MSYWVKIVMQRDVIDLQGLQDLQDLQILIFITQCNVRLYSKSVQRFKSKVLITLYSL